MATDIKTIHLLLIEPSSNHAEEIINTLRNRGYAVRATQVLSQEELIEALEKQVSDLLLTIPDHHALPAKQAIEQISQFGRDIPTIVMFEQLTDENFVEALTYGASNTTSHTNLEMLCLRVEKELSHLDVRRAKTQAELALTSSEKRCSLLLDSSRDAIAYIHDGMHVYANKAYLELFGYTDHDEILCVPALDTIDKKNQEEFKKHLKDMALDHDQHNFSFSGAKADGDIFDAIMSLSQAHFEDENCTQVLIRQETDSAELEEKLKEISALDTVTDLYNKIYFSEQIELTQARAIEKSCTYNLLYIEYDQHNKIRGEYGIPGVDSVTRECASWLSDRVDGSYTLARLTDHAFGILIEDKSTQIARDLAKKLCETIKDHLFDIDGHTHTVTFSIGICPISEEKADPNRYISDAQSAAARLDKGDGFKVYNKAAANVAEGIDQHLVDEIQDAIDAGRIKLLFQPIVKLHGEEKALYQALLRLTTDDGKEISPEKVFPIARMVGLGVKLDKWIISQALRSIKSCKNDNLQIFVHLSSVSLIDETMADFIDKTFKNSKLEKNRLIFQFDEEDAANHLKRVIALSANLKSKGYVCCLSKFGNDLEQVQLIDQIDVDFVKISDKVSDNLHLDPESTARIQTLLDEIHNRDKLSIIPKVEEAAMLAALWPMNVSYIQGYYLQRPSIKLDYDFSSSGF